MGENPVGGPRSALKWQRDAARRGQAVELTRRVLDGESPVLGWP